MLDQLRTPHGKGLFGGKQRERLIVINQILMLVGEMMHIDMSDITNIDAIIDGIIKKKEAK